MVAQFNELFNEHDFSVALEQAMAIKGLTYFPGRFERSPEFYVFNALNWQADSLLTGIKQWAQDRETGVRYFYDVKTYEGWFDVCVQIEPLA